MSDSYPHYDRFVYRRDDTPDLAPPHCVWDKAKNEWSALGAFSSEPLAQAAALGMNAARELFKKEDRRLAGVLSDLKRAVKTIEDLQATSRRPTDAPHC